VNVDLNEIRRIAEWLREACGDDDQAFIDMIEGETNAFEALEVVHRSLQGDDELITGIKARQAELASRLSRIEARKETKRKTIGMILRAAGLKKAELVEATVSIRDGKAKLIVGDADAIPDEYVRTKREADKKAINAAFEDAEELPNWLSRSDPQDVLTIRSK